MKKLIGILYCLTAFQALAIDFHVSFLKDYKTLVFGNIMMSSRNVLELEILDTIVSYEEMELSKGMMLTIPYSNYRFDLNEQREAVVALKNDNGNWRVERIFMGQKETDFVLQLKNQLSSISLDVREFAAGLQLIYSDLNLDISKDRSVNYASNLGKVTLKVSEEKFEKDVLSNDLLAHVFTEWDYFQCFTTPLGFGFWQDLASKTDSLIAANPNAISIPFIDQNNKTNHLFTRFQRTDSLSNVLSEYVYFFDPLRYTFRQVYTYTPEKPFKKVDNSKIIFYTNYGFFSYSTLDTQRFGDYYFPDNSMFQLGMTDLRQIVVPQYDSSGVIEFYTLDSDTLVARVTKGQFTGKFLYSSKENYFEKNFDDEGRAHGAFAIYEKAMGKLLHYEHYSANVKSGHYYSSFPSGHAHLKGAYYNNRRIGEWIEYYPQENGGGIKSKNNYTYYNNCISNELSLNWSSPKILSNRYIDEENIRFMDGFQIYFDTDGSKLSFQNWKNGELLHRQDWYRQTLSSEIDTDSVGSIVLDIRDTIFHTSGEYQSNKPWSGTFLAGAHHFLGGSASGRGPQICISIDRYQEGILIAKDTIYNNRSNELIRVDIARIQENSGEINGPRIGGYKKKGLFKKKKNVRLQTCGGKIIEGVEGSRKHTKKKKTVDEPKM